MEKHRQNAPCKNRRLQLLPYEIRENLPILGSQQGKGGHAKIWAKCSTPDGAFAWYITEGSARRNTAGKALDYLLYGLVDSDRRAPDYFWLSDLVCFRSPAGQSVERDVHWRSQSLADVAPEMFQINRRQQED